MSGEGDVKQEVKEELLGGDDEEETMDTTTAASDDAADEDDRKLFAGGLPQDARDADLRAHFGQFGEVESVNLKTDPHTGRSRGFAFVVFREVDGVTAAVSDPEHVIKGKKVAVKKAQSKQGKVYIGKLKSEISDDDVKEFFSQYGTIAGIEQPFDKIKNERKNFCFITFEKEEPAKRLLKEGIVSIKGHELEVKKVTPKADPRTMYGGGPMGAWGGYGAGGGGGWGYGDYWSGGYGGMDPYYSGWGYAGAAGWGYGGGGYSGGKSSHAPRGRAASSSSAAARGQQRQKPY